MKFKTNIKCGGCVATVTRVLDEIAGKDKWQVDLSSPDHLLTTEEVDDKKLATALKGIGYAIVKVNGETTY